ncbi:RHS repeat domain-containing protein [Pseudomonas sp. CC120222-01a]|uniref:RHS repeat domain-containing protein n=1 Tax=Pseudomonas sp. CC120222-01a TaxID=1378075 RepID=UPI000DE5C593|nr:sugar-binding protein [Pseudomonas sp. CC120222-01a]PVZ39487.1 hypothetical protein N430_03722 [Pseudomonas sp. CC120222-01a]
MTTKSLLHSNAFNFLSFFDNSVDPRTGLYTLAIELPELVANNLAGPSLPLRIGFSPMNIEDSGFGRGWTLNLSQYTPADNMLHLHTGESFRVDGSTDDGTGRLIKERKLRSFLFHDHGDGYRVEHKSGMIELLEVKGPSDNRVALPTRVEAPSGHGITLRYDDSLGALCLIGIKDDSGLDLLLITYGSDRVTLDLHPYSGPGGKPLATYTLGLDNQFTPAVRVLESIALPSDDKASWALEYDKVREVVCLTAVRTPVGGTELIEYADEGHRFPDDTHPALPRVTKHTIKPGHDQADMVTSYTYTSENFLGWGSGASWEDNGEDNLYKSTDRAFRYGSTATSLLGSTPLRSITRRFDRFHLLKLQRTEQAHEVYYRGAELPRRETCIQEAETVYHETDAMFEFQPPFFQMPKYQIKRWKIQEDATRLREEVLITDYDEHGNLTLESVAAAPVYKGNEIDQQATLATTVHTRHTYYPHTGEGDDCPPDLQLFTRSRKTSTEHPAKTDEGKAATSRTRYRYRALKALTGSTLGKGWLVAHEEELSQLVGEQEQLQQFTFRKYQDLPGEALQHGRMVEERQILNDDETTTEHRFAKRPELGEEVLEEIRTLTGFDHGDELEDGAVRHAQKIQTLLHSVLINQPLQNYDDNEVKIAYVYDALRRVLIETVSPDDDDENGFKAARKYTYTLVSQAGGQATQTAEDVKGVITRTLVDGLNRAIAQSRQDADNADISKRAAFRPTYAARYDALGDKVGETDYDWLDYPNQPPSELALPRQRLFDGWGRQYCEIAVDKVRHYDRYDPIGTSASKGPIRTQWRESADRQQATGTTVTWLTLFDEPARIERLDASDASYSVSQTYYDGLQRKAREVNARNETKHYVYDVFNRLVDETVADDSVVHRDYAPHSREDLPVKISVNGVVLGEQRFDGLDRMVESITGGRVRVFGFEPGQMKPNTVLTPRKELIEYRYRPELSDEPELRRIAAEGIEADYDYNHKNALLERCEEQGLVLKRKYYSNGEVLSETREYQGETSEMHYQTSLLGRQLGYTDVGDVPQVYEYDGYGRLRQTTLETSVATFEYDGLGRMCRTLTQGGGQRLETLMMFDEFDREVQRQFDIGGTLQSLTQGYDVEDAIVWKILTEGDIHEVLRHETYEYDVRGRLRKYRCEGRLSPVDQYGNVMQEQIFRHDEIDNITRVDTRFAEGLNQARYYFENEDPAQLSRIENNHPDYPATIPLAYDEDGNLTLDDAGRVLTYDGLGRLINVEVPALIEEAFDQHGNRVWDEGGRRFTADEQGRVIRVDVPSATHPVDTFRGMRSPAGELLTAVREKGGRLLWCVSVANADVVKYGYDPLDRLTSEEY